MQVLFTNSFSKRFKKLPSSVQSKFSKKLKYLLADSNHPSLRTHKLKGRLSDFYSLSINDAYRAVYRKLDKDVIEFVNIGDHSIYNV